MPVLVVIHRLKDFDEWIKVFKSNPHQKLVGGDCSAESMIEIECTLSRNCKRQRSMALKNSLLRNACRMCFDS
jgi:hypothetical protein